MTVWADADLLVLRERYPHERTADIAAALGRPIGQVYQTAARHGLHKSEAFNASDLSARIKRGKQSPAMKASQFKKGQTPFNKGLRRPGWAPGRMASTQFKAGEMRGAAQHNYVPIGSERISKDGYPERKITDDPDIYPARRWVAVHRLVWEASNGLIPAGRAVVFRPGCKTEDVALITIDRLELVTRAELMRRNSRHTNYPPELNRLIQLKGALNRKINKRSKAA